MAGQLTIDTLRAGSGVLATQNGMTGVGKGWVNFNGISGSVAIRSSFNVSSVTRNGTGDYSISFTTTMPDANFAVVISCQRGDGAGIAPAYTNIYATAANAYTSITTTSVRFSTAGSNTAGLDMPYVGVVVLGN
jgi:hypothetical protein